MIALLLVAGPVGFTLARESGFRASVELFPGPVKPYASELDPAYYRSLLADPELHTQMRLNAHADISEYRRAAIGTVGGRTPLTITVRADSPARAQELVNALAPQIVGASRRELRTRATGDAAALRSRLRSGRLDRTARRAARRRIRRVERLLASTRDPAVLGPLAPKPRLRSWADRLADALPGSFPTRPSPLGAGLAGLLIAVTLWAIALVVVSPGREWGRVRRTRGSSGAPSADAVAREERPTRSQTRGLPGWRRVAWVAALVVVPVVTLAGIATNAVNVPFHDEWSLVSLFQAAQHGTLAFGDFWAQHNEHRPLFPRAADFGLAYVTGWDIRVELYLDFAVAAATLVGLLAALRRSLERRTFLVASVVTSVIFFSPVQWENWLWGWQLEWFLCNLVAVGMIWALTVGFERSPGRGIRLGAVCAFVGTFSLGQGLVLWPVGLALLVLRRRPWRAWAVLSVAAFALYFAGWTNTGEPSKTIFLSHPFRFIEFICIYLGRPLAVSTGTGVAVGAVLLLTFVFAAVYVTRRREDSQLIARAEFWLALGAYVLGAAVITAVSREGFGLIGAAVSRYAGMAGLFAIATMGVVFSILRGEEVAGRAITASARRWGTAAVAVPLVLMALVNARHGLDDMQMWHRDKREILTCARQARTAEDPCLDRRALNGGRLQFDQIEFTRARGWAGF